MGNPYQSYLDWALAAATKNPAFNEAVFAPNGIGRDYNYNLAYLNGDNPGANGHLSDIGKLPNHRTFSNESNYAIGNMGRAGQWVEPLSEQGQWLYNNPSRGLNMMPESAAYQPRTSGMESAARIYNALNNPKNASSLFKSL